MLCARPGGGMVEHAGGLLTVLLLETFYMQPTKRSKEFRKDMLLPIVWKRLRLRYYEILALALIALAVVSRLILIANSWPATTSEEGTFGLEALHIAYRGELPIFMYGQNYMGVLEAYLGAILYHLFGVSLFTLRLGMIIFFAFFLLCMYYLTKLLYSPQMALITLAVLSVGSQGVLLPEMMVLGGTAETLLFGALLLLLATWLSLHAGEEALPRKKWHRLAGFAAWGCCAGLGLWSHLLVAPFILVSGILLLIFCQRELRRVPALFLLAGLVIGLFPLIAYNVTAAPGHDSIHTFLQIYTIGMPSASALDPYFAEKQLSGTFLFSLPVATGLNTPCDVRSMPFFTATPTPIGCTLIQGGWSLGYLILLTVATAMAVRGLGKVRKLHRSNMLDWPAEDRRIAVMYVAQLMLLLSAAITLFLFAHSPNSASRPWSTRYLVGLLVATPALLWPLWNGITSHISTVTSQLRCKPFIALFRYSILLLLVLFFATEMWYTTTEIPSIDAMNAQDKALTFQLIHLGFTRIYSGYWQCDRFIFLTQEKIICSVLNEDMSSGLTRYAPYTAIVHADPEAIYVFPQNSPYEKNFEQKMGHSNEKFQKIVLDGYVVYRPEH